jgi:hypothetical protein
MWPTSEFFRRDSVRCRTALLTRSVGTATLTQTVPTANTAELGYPGRHLRLATTGPPILLYVVPISAATVRSDGASVAPNSKFRNSDRILLLVPK